ncbi:MAG: alpha-amylase family glycosyl hydrolase [Rubrivivax sp.]
MRLDLLRTLAALGLCLGLGLPATSAPPASPGAPTAALDTTPVPARPRSNGLPPHWERGAFIEIFVRAWKDSDGDGIGDLRGLIATLDELKDLGIRGIWLMPVTGNADGDHGYATTDFRAIAPEYGTLADFDELLRQAHARGIGVIMDYVINHASAQHPFFNEALKGPDNPFHRWFIWSDTAPEGWDIWGAYPWYHAASRPWGWPGSARTVPPAPADARGFYYGTFGPHMPDFDFRNPAVQAYHLDSLRFWLNRGLDGFRLDATPHLFETSAKDWNDQPESRAFTKRLQDLIKTYPQRYVVCEATAKPDEWGDPAVCGGAFAFGYVHHIALAARGQAESVQRVATHWATASPTMATFLSNHDSFAGRRLWDQLQGDERRMRVAAATHLLQPGTPFVYYGEPIGQAGLHGPEHGLEGDPPLRGPVSWTADPRTGGFTTGTPFRPVAPNAATHNAESQRRDAGSLRNFYRTVIGLRNAHPSIARGSFDRGSAQGRVAVWQRRLDEPGPKGAKEHTVTIVNYDDAPAPAVVSGLPPRARLVSLLPAGGATAARADAQGQATLLLAPLSVRVLQVSTAPEPRRRDARRR